MTRPLDPEVPLTTRLLHAASALNLLADVDTRRMDPHHIETAPALIKSIPALLTEAATTLIGKQAVLRGLMDTYTAAGGEGVATHEAIHAAIKLGASTDNDLRHIRVAVEQSLGMQAEGLLSQSVATMATELRAYKEHSKRLNDAICPTRRWTLVSIVLPALRFEDKRITSNNTLSVLCGDREVWTGNGACELDIRTTVIENQISYAHPVTFDSMMEAKGTIWLQANDEAAALLRTYRNGSIGLVLCFPAVKSLFTALLFDLPDGSNPPSDEPGWHGFGLVLETP